MSVSVLVPEATLSDVRTAAAETARSLIELRSVPADKRGENYATDVREHADAILHFDLIEKGLDAAERAAKAKADSESRGSKSQGANLTPEMRSLGAQVIGAEGYEEWAQRGASTPFIAEVRTPGGGEVRNLIGSFTTGAYDSGSDGFMAVQSVATIAPGQYQRRRPFLRDLLSVVPTGLHAVRYLRETNQITNETGAQMVAEGSAKPEVTAQFEEYTAIAETIAAWIPVTNQIVRDAPTLMGYINTRLEYMLMIREEQQILAGTGTSPQLQGLDTLSGTQSQAVVTGGGAGTAGDYPATIGAAIGKIENVDGDADGVATNPLDYWAATAKRHANQFDNGFGGGAPASPGGITWGLPAVRSRAVDSGKAFVGAWRLGGTLHDREGVTVKVGDQHSDYMIRNLSVVLLEKAVALAWHRPALFVEAVVPTS